jgi:hypothetical protein
MASALSQALTGYFTPSHVKHQRLLLQFLSVIAVINKHTAKLHHVGSLYILTYDARKIKHKMYGISQNKPLCEAEQRSIYISFLLLTCSTLYTILQDTSSCPSHQQQ